MKKYFSLILFAFTLIISISIPSHSYNSVFINSDNESYDGYLFYQIEDATGFVYSEKSIGEKRRYYTDYLVEGIAVLNGNIYASSNEKIHIINTDNGNDNILIDEKGIITRFSVTENRIYYLMGGDIKIFDISSHSGKDLIKDKRINNFWLDDINTISYMIDEFNIYHFDLSNGNEYVSVNNYSLLNDKITAANNQKTAPLLLSSVSSLRNKFPDGKYWNHQGSSRNNPNGYTSTPCTHHAGNCSYDGSCGCNSFSSAIQCMGYAYKCGYDITGYAPSSGSGGWRVSASSSGIDTVKAGDIIRYRNDGHSIYVIGVSGDTIKFTDCNHDGHCGIRWDATISKSTVKSTFTKIYIAPFNCGTYTIALDANGGSVNLTSIQVANGEEIGSLPVPVREGYLFQGWYTSESGGKLITETTCVDLDSFSKLYAHWRTVTYTVEFNSNGGSNNLPSSFVKKYNESVYIGYTKPTQKGYSFECWNTRADGSGISYNSGDKYSENSSCILYAKWKPNQYLVNFNANGGTVNVSSKKYNYGSPYGELPIAERMGFEFEGWFTYPSGGEQIFDSTVVSITSTSTYYAHWKVQTYSIIYNANGGIGAPEAQIKKYGSSVNLSNSVPYRKGFIFINWNTSPNGSGTEYRPGSLYSMEKSVELYAQWEREKYVVEFFSNGGEDVPEIKFKEYNIDFVIGTEIPKRKGYEFTGWNTESGGGGTSYQVGEKYTMDSSVQFYAQWKPCSYTVRFYGNGGIIDSAFKTVVYDSEYGSLPIAERKGYTFAGWFTEKSGGTEIFAYDTVLITENISLYAGWKINEYEIVFFANGGTAAPNPMKKVYSEDLILSYDIPQRNGYTFVSWNTKKDGSGEAYISGALYSANDSVALYAIWKENEYTVNFNLNGGKGDFESVKVLHYSAVSITENEPLKYGYGFAGWNTARDGSGEAYFPGDCVTTEKDLILYAMWEPVEVDVLLETEGGVCKKNSLKCLFNEKVGALPNAEKDGYEFLGWFFDETLNERVFESSKINCAETIKIYAGWKKAQCIIMFNSNGGICDKAYTSVEKNGYCDDIPIPSRTGCTFEGWYTEGQSEFSCKTQITDNITVYAAWSIDDAEISDKSYTVKWIFNGKTYEERYSAGEKISVYYPETESGYVFCGWNAEVPVRMPDENIEFNAVYEPIEYEVAFIASGKLVKKVYFSVESSEITVPEVPERIGYSGEWSYYSNKLESKTVYAIYTPVKYSAVFSADGAEIAYVGYSVEDKYISEPDIPQKAGYIAAWEKYELAIGGIVIKAEYKPIDYNAVFIADRQVIASIKYTVETEALKEPYIPEKAGYSSSWRKYELSPGGIHIYAKYEPIVYVGKFISNGITVETFEYTVETVAIDEPDIPAMNGYTGNWEKYDIAPGGMNINAIYVPNKYIVSFFAGEVSVSDIEFTYGDSRVKEPELPEREGYNGHWEEYTLGSGNCVVNAVYIPIIYRISFCADGILIAEYDFTVERSYIKNPEIPPKSGYIAHWENYEIRAGDITVNAVYDVETYIKILGYVKTANIDYGTSMVFYADVGGLKENQEIHWFINGIDCGTGNENGSFVVSEVKTNFKIRAAIVEDNKAVQNTDIEIVTVNKSFFKKFIAFFRKLFGIHSISYQK